MNNIPRPLYIFRGHEVQISYIHFFKKNKNLATCDANGWVIIWNVFTRRPIIVWRAHLDSVLTCHYWNDNYFITHGRDNKIYIWQLEFEYEEGLEIYLPIDQKEEYQKKPWMVYSLNINSLNYCSFSVCDKVLKKLEDDVKDEIFMAVPNSNKNELIDIYVLPNCQLVYSEIGSTKETTGIIMSLCIYYRQKLSYKTLEISAGFESGHVGVFLFSPVHQVWETKYLFKVHTEPVLSIHCDPHYEFLISSGSDSFVVKYYLDSDSDNILKFKTRHVGQQSLRIRSDAKIFATAGWDGKVRVYSCNTLSQLAVCKWHETGCYSIAFSEIIPKHYKILGSFEKNKQLERSEKHWLAAGGKDGKVSLWEIC
ncbi:uncharacterized protein T551_03112 [Pneumocystis jirovecii RU7]|uniref:ASTRA-associated protein 1 n=1 Tax=Pneumocystis jirovecii (strain RU7) TaxID=1408657 RepID=A0A0W4ZFH5_PNEJ7|nr:uncharacterized protein T551_03112 [Pneumocystis jirovecii RU7]KTW27118.1 hypothetical protein T551_03112 [Pneumocystis jirovecii RU7]